uniref:Syntaxin 10 n=1 Tax=Chelonoidis abingdonii TaxID=106734 RepID=A0A8C0GWC7_CHEAB
MGMKGNPESCLVPMGWLGPRPPHPLFPAPVLPTPTPRLCPCPAHWVLSSGTRIVESNPRKFRIEASELTERRSLATPSGQLPGSVPSQGSALSLQMLIGGGASQKPPPERYGQLREELVSANSRYIEEQQLHQQLIIDQQDEQLELVSGSIRVLKNMSGRVGDELDEQSLMLEEFAQEMDHTQSRMDGVLKKMAKVTHMTSDRRQWCVIGILLILLIVVLILFFTL